MKPNLGQFEEEPEWKTVLKFFRGNELQNFFTKLLEDDLKALIKVQYVDAIIKQKAVKTQIVGKKLRQADKRGIYDDAVETLELGSILERQIE